MMHTNLIAAKYYELEARYGGLAEADAATVRRETAEAMGVSEDDVRDAVARDMFNVGAG